MSQYDGRKEKTIMLATVESLARGYIADALKYDHIRKSKMLNGIKFKSFIMDARDKLAHEQKQGRFLSDKAVEIFVYRESMRYISK